MIYKFDELPSTNDYAKEHIHEWKDFDIIWALKQTKGRGRFERSWLSDDDMTFSIVSKKPYLMHGIISPLAIVQALQHYHIQAKIKWPNDIIVKGKKVCGILVEKLYEGEAIATIIGIGINLQKKQHATLVNKAGYVTLPKEELLSCIVKEYEQLLSLTNQNLVRKYNEYHMLYQKHILYEGKEYTIKHVDEEGRLCIASIDERKYLYSGEITMEKLYKEMK